MSVTDHVRSLESKLSMIGLLAFLPALVSAAFALWSAVTRGEITVYVLPGGKFGEGIAPAAVSWTEGWARLASPLILLAALFVQGERGCEAVLFPFARALLILIGIGMLVAPAAYMSVATFAATHGAVCFLLFAFYIAETHRNAKALVVVASTVLLVVLIFAVVSLGRAN
jgi:hypothetical protein